MSTTTHYNDTFTLQFSPEKRRLPYSHVESGEKYRRVSTVVDKVLAKDLAYWAAKCGSEYVVANLKPGDVLDEVGIAALAAGSLREHNLRKESSADSGIFVHDWLHAMLRGEVRKLPDNNQMALACTAAFQWFNKRHWQLVMAETPVVSLKMKLAGTPDAIGYLDGKLTIIDWKTGKDVYYSALIQMALYALMFEEEFGIKIEQLVLVNASLKSPFKTFTTQRLPHLREMARAVYKLDKSMRVFDKMLEKGDRDGQ